MTQGRTWSCACCGNQPLGFDEVTKCAEKQLNTSAPPEAWCPAGSSPTPSGRVLLGPAGRPHPPLLPQPLHGLVPGFSCFSHSRVVPTVHILKAALPPTDSWEISTGANIHPHASHSCPLERNRRVMISHPAVFSWRTTKSETFGIQTPRFLLYGGGSFSDDDDDDLVVISCALKVLFYGKEFHTFR